MSDQQDRKRRHTREVQVNQAGLSEATNRRLTEEVRDAVGSDRVEVPVDRPAPSAEHASERRATPVGIALAPNRFIFTMVGGSGLVIAVIIGLLVGSWWALAGAVVVLGLVTFVVVRTVLSMTSNRERPSATTVAALEEEGVTNPEAHFSELVKEFTPDDGSQGGRRTSGVEDDHLRAAAEQEGANTPSGGPSKPVGP